MDLGQDELVICDSGGESGGRASHFGAVVPAEDHGPVELSVALDTNVSPEEAVRAGIGVEVSKTNPLCCWKQKR